MKKFILVTAAALLLSLAPAAAQSNNSILNNGIEVYGIPGKIRFVPYSDYTGKFGFVRNISNLSVIVRPKYEDISVGFLLVGVKMNGKWGVVDIGARYKKHTLCEPVIPCIYSHIEIKSDNVVVCDGEVKDITQLGYEKW